MPYSKKTNEYTDVVSFVTYMNFSEVEQWKDSYSIDSKKKDRGEAYHQWKEQKEQRFLNVIEKEVFPGIREHIINIESSTPLTYRDYIGNTDGALYGSSKDYKSPMKTFVNTRTKIPNLLLTGQFLNLHGVLGVTVSSFITCFEFIDREYLVNKIKSA
jgi:all-trans-retinol 13,14-reductase